MFINIAMSISWHSFSSINLATYISSPRNSGVVKYGLPSCHIGRGAFVPSHYFYRENGMIPINAHHRCSSSLVFWEKYKRTREHTKKLTNIVIVFRYLYPICSVVGLSSARSRTAKQQKFQIVPTDKASPAHLAREGDRHEWRGLIFSDFWIHLSVAFIVFPFFLRF